MLLLSLILVQIEKWILLGIEKDTRVPPNVTSVFEMTLLSPNYQTMIIWNRSKGKHSQVATGHLGIFCRRCSIINIVLFRLDFNICPELYFFTICWVICRFIAHTDYLKRSYSSNRNTIMITILRLCNSQILKIQRVFHEV